jgi:uncharacterized alkaline shock family protein YloU
LKEPSIETSQDDYAQSKGRTTIAPEVLLTIAQLTALNVPGVSRMSNVPGGVNKLFQRGVGEGVRIEICEEEVLVDLYIILQNDVNIREVGRQVQHSVTRAISETVGMHIGRVNVHVEDIDYPEEVSPDHAGKIGSTAGSSGGARPTGD